MRVTIGADPRDVTVTPLSFDWFMRALADKTLPASLKPTRGERDQILLAATQPELQAWLAARSRPIRRLASMRFSGSSEASAVASQNNTREPSVYGTAISDAVAGPRNLSPSSLA